MLGGVFQEGKHKSGCNFQYMCFRPGPQGVSKLDDAWKHADVTKPAEVERRSAEEETQ